MAKKRKNDTRLDPFATAVGSSSLDALLEQANAGDVIRMPAPSDPARQITLVCKRFNTNSPNKKLLHLRAFVITQQIRHPIRSFVQA